MTTAKPTVGNMADIDKLLATTGVQPESAAPAPAAPKPTVGESEVPQTMADYQAMLEAKTGDMCEAYIAHRIGGGKKKEFLATLSKEDRNLFLALDLDTMAKIAMKEHLDANPDDNETNAVYEALVAKEKARLANVADVTGANLPGNPKPAKSGKGKKSKKISASDNKTTRSVHRAVEFAIGRHVKAWFH